jgi:hypothetical protein
MSILRLSKQPDVSWARFGRYGEGGSWGYQIDASGADIRNRMMHQDLLPATSDVSLQTRIRLKSSLVVGNPAFEGLAVKHRGFQMEGSTATEGDIQKWDSQPETQGKAAWISGQNTEYTTFNFLNEIPVGLGIDYCTWELELRAISGQVEIDNIECRYFYGKSYDLDIIGSQSWLAGQLTLEQMDTYSETNIDRYVKYLKTIDIVCRKGQMIIADSNGAIRGAVVNQSLADIPVITGFMLKLRRAGLATEDVFDATGTYSTTIKQGRYTQYDQTQQRRARYDYDRVQLVAYTEPHTRPSDTSQSPDEIAYVNPNMDLYIADFVGPSQ